MPPFDLRRLAIVLLLLVAAPCLHAETSTLWGKQGELWKPDQPLRDFSSAGFAEGSTNFPRYPAGADVTRFGARGNDTNDDTVAFVRALEACPPRRAVFIPNGTYVLTNWIVIQKSEIVLRGQSRNGVRLRFPIPLETLHPNMGKTTTGRPTSNWSWSGGFLRFEKVRQSGVESLTLEFPEVPYPNHFNEKGYNGVVFRDSHDSWAQGLTFLNCDSGIFAEAGSTHLTFRDLLFDEYPGRAVNGIGGHHGVDFSRSTNCLADRIVFRNQFFHELGIEHGACFNVYMRCSGPDLHLDHHQVNVHDNLWTDIDLGAGKAVWKNNAHSLLKSRAGSTANEVYWNIRSARPLPYPEPEHRNIVVGMTTDEPSSIVPGSHWHETLKPQSLVPPNLYLAQRALRSTRPGPAR